MMARMDERVRAELSVRVKDGGRGLAQPRGPASAGPRERLRYSGVAALCLVAVALLSPLNVYLLIMVELLFGDRLGGKAVYALAALAQAALFGLLWLPLDSATRRWPAPARCFATVALTAAYLGLWLALNLLAFGW
jgi:hypothetical protein